MMGTFSGRKQSMEESHFEDTVGGLWFSKPHRSRSGQRGERQKPQDVAAQKDDLISPIS